MLQTDSDTQHIYVICEWKETASQQYFVHVI